MAACVWIIIGLVGLFWLGMGLACLMRDYSEKPEDTNE